LNFIIFQVANKLNDKVMGVFVIKQTNKNKFPLNKFIEICF